MPTQNNGGDGEARWNRARRRRKQQPGEHAPPDDTSWTSPDGAGQLTDIGGGMLQCSLAGTGGDVLYSVRQPDGSLACMFTWEERERWFVHVVVFACGPYPVKHVIPNLGPYPTLQHACRVAGRKAGEFVLEWQRRHTTDGDDGPSDAAA